MDKKLKKRVIDQFAKYMQAELQTFVLFQEKSDYFFSSEKVWEDVSTVPGANLYIIFTPEFKGRDQFTIEIGWSKLRRFPRVITRPFLAFKSDFENCYELQEATTRLPYITGEKEWIDINMDNSEEVIQKQIKNLIEYGMPFLMGIKI